MLPRSAVRAIDAIVIYIHQLTRLGPRYKNIYYSTERKDYLARTDGPSPARLGTHWLSHRARFGGHDRASRIDRGQECRWTTGTVKNRT